MSDVLEAARALQARLYADASKARDRETYLATVANYNDAARIVSLLETEQTRGLDNDGFGVLD